AGWGAGRGRTCDGKTRGTRWPRATKTGAPGTRRPLTDGRICPGKPTGGPEADGPRAGGRPNTARASADETLRDPLDQSRPDAGCRDGEDAPGGDRQPGRSEPRLANRHGVSVYHAPPPPLALPSTDAMRGPPRGGRRRSDPYGEQDPAR